MLKQIRVHRITKLPKRNFKPSRRAFDSTMGFYRIAIARKLTFVTDRWTDTRRYRKNRVIQIFESWIFHRTFLRSFTPAPYGNGMCLKLPPSICVTTNFMSQKILCQKFCNRVCKKNRTQCNA